jgi:hypothetical protein
MTIKEYKQGLKWLPKEEKIRIINGELTRRQIVWRPGVGIRPSQRSGQGNRKTEEKPLKVEPKNFEKKKVEQEKIYSPTNEELTALLQEIESNVEAYESETKRKELIPFMHDRDLNFYYNKKNFPAWERLIEPTVNFIENERKGLFETIDFLNLVDWHYYELQRQHEKPFVFIDHIKNLPLSKEESHLLLAALLKWYGGIPAVSDFDALYVIRKMVEKEFLSQYPKEQTLEKLFCSTDEKSKKLFGELAANLSAGLEGVKVVTGFHPDIHNKYDFAGSNYVNKINFDFGELPHYIIKQAIISRFENIRISKDEEYYEWQDKLVNFLNSIPNEYRLEAITKGIQYGRAVYKYHLDKECTNHSKCPLNESWERRIALAEGLLARVKPKASEKEDIEPTSKIHLNEKVVSKTDFIRIINVLMELRAFKTEDGQIPTKKAMVELFDKFIDANLSNFHADLNKALEKSEEANIQIFETMKNKAIELWNNKNYK